ncbi:MAG: hypothetical protein M0019_06755 [Actinomycetota bacterium]|nr:hypothetical protein [Actinomycetota bacterium]
MIPANFSAPANRLLRHTISLLASIAFALYSISIASPTKYLYGWNLTSKKMPLAAAPSVPIYHRLALWNAHGITLKNFPQIWFSPMNLSPMIPGADPTEGVWSPIGTNAGPGFATFETFVTPYAGGPKVSVAWINQDYAQVQMFAGTSQPGGSWPYEGSIPQSLWPKLIGAFEGGFIFNQSNGGWYADGRYGLPLVQGAASIVSYSNGTVDIGAWGSEVSMTPSVTGVRQNLIPLVDNGRVVAAANQNPLVTWGFSLGNILNTWRSGLGITASGALIYVGGPGLSPAELGAVLVWAGAIRGMQLDMNPYWVNYIQYTYGQNGLQGSDLLPNMNLGPSHYLNGFWRDFLAVLLK